MKSGIIALMLFSVFTNKLLAQPQLIHKWSAALHTYPDYERGAMEGGFNVSDAAGNFYMAGTFKNTADFDPSTNAYNLSTETGSNGNGYLAKYNASGQFQFAKIIGRDAGIIYIDGLTNDNSGNLYVVGSFTGKADFHTGEAEADTAWYSGSNTGFIAKYNNTGNLIYVSLLEADNSITSNIFFSDIKVGSNNTIYLTGTFRGKIDMNPGAPKNEITPVSENGDGFLAMYNANTGAFNYVTTFYHNGTLFLTASALLLDTQNNCLVAGSFRDTIHFAGPNATTVTMQSSGESDIFLAKWDAAGVFIQAERAGGTGNDAANKLLIDANGALYMAGSFNGTADLNKNSGVTTNVTKTGAGGFLSKYASNGALEYVHEISNVSKLGLGLNNDIIAVGKFRGTRDFDLSSGGVANLVSALPGTDDIYVASYTNNGLYKWAFRISSTGNKQVGGLASISPNRIVVTGTYISNLNLNPASSTTFPYLPPFENTFLGAYEMSTGLHSFSGVIGVNRTETDMARSVGVDSQGDVIVTGNFSNGSDADPGEPVVPLTSAGGQDIFVAKYSKEGLLKFAFRAGGPSTDQGRFIAIDNDDNIYVTGNFSGTANFDPSPTPNINATLVSSGSTDVFISKYSPEGEWLFSKKIGGSSAELAYKLVIDKDNNLLLAGSFALTCDFDPHPVNTANLTSLGNYDGFFAKYNAQGDFIFAKQIGSTSYDENFSITSDAQANVYVAGLFTGTVDFDPAPATTLNKTAVGSRDAFFAKYNSTGNLIFAHGLGSNSADQANDIIIDKAGNIVVAGSYFNTIDVNPDPVATKNFTSFGSNDSFIGWYTPSGNYINAIAWGANGGDDPRAIRTDANNNIIVTGRFSGTGDFNPDPSVTNNLTGGAYDAFVAAYSSTGQYIFAKDFGSIDNDDAHGLFVDTLSKSIYVCGGFSLQVNFATAGQPTAMLETDIDANGFIARFLTQPEPGSISWTGAANTAWENPANWSGNEVPNSSSVVIIPSGLPRYPIVNVSSTVKSLQCLTGSSVTVVPGAILKILQ